MVCGLHSPADRRVPQSHGQIYRCEFRKKMVWRLICEDIATNRPGKLCPSAAQCENKWKSLTAALRKVTDHNTTGHDRKECAFYKELMDVVGRKANITPPCLGGQGKSATDNYSRRSSTCSSDDDSLQAVTVTPVTVGPQVASSPGTPTATLLSAGNCSASQDDVVPDIEEEVDEEPLKKKRKTSHRSEGKSDIVRLTEALEKARAAHSLASECWHEQKMERLDNLTASLLALAKK